MNIRIQRTISDAFLPVFMATVGAQASTSLPATPVIPKPVAEHHETVTPQIRVAAETTHESEVRVKLHHSTLPLSPGEERVFHELAVKEADGTITQHEQHLLEELDRRRFFEERAVSPATIVMRERILAKVEDLISELNAYQRR